jgi:hypothetical protein
MPFGVDVDISGAITHFERITPQVHDALLRALKPLADQAASNARNIAWAHIHYMGTKPGMYVASIYGGVSDKGTSVIGYARSTSPLAHLLEWGANLPERDIVPEAGNVMKFTGSAGDVFARAVHFPGARMPAYPALTPALKSIADQLESALTKAAKGAVG